MISFLPNGIVSGKEIFCARQDCNEGYLSGCKNEKRFLSEGRG